MQLVAGIPLLFKVVGVLVLVPITGMFLDQISKIEYRKTLKRIFQVIF